MRGYHWPMRDLLAKSPLEVGSLGRAPIGEPGFLPALGGVYLAIDAADRVWYVGQALSIRNRLSAHEKMPLFLEKKATLIAWQTEPDEERCAQLEIAAIGHFHPPLNDQHNFNALPHADFGLTPDEEIERYLQRRIDLKLIELELAALGPNIVSHCEQAGGKITHGLGSIWYLTAKSYNYSSECEQQKQALLLRQKTEKEDGTAAVKSETTSPRYKLNAAALSAEIAARMAPFLEAQNAEAAAPSE